MKEESDGQSNKLYIFYYSQETFEKDIDNDIDCEWINLYEMTADAFERARRKHEMSIVYLTNAFDVSYTIRNQGMGEFADGKN